MAGRHTRRASSREHLPVPAVLVVGVLLVVVLLGAAPGGADGWVRLAAGLAVLVVALPALAALVVGLRSAGRAEEHAAARRAEVERLSSALEAVRAAAADSDRRALAEHARLRDELATSRADVRTARDELAGSVERIGVLGRQLGATALAVDDLHEQLRAGRDELTAAREAAGAARDEAAAARDEAAAGRKEAARAAAALDTKADAIETKADALTGQVAALQDQLRQLTAQNDALRTQLAALRAELDARAEGLEATTVRMTLPLVRAALRRDAGGTDRARDRRTGGASA